MIFLAYLFIELPGINRAGCQNGSAFSCSDLDFGLKKLDSLLKRNRTYYTKFNPRRRDTASLLFSNIFAVAYALATDSTPIIDSALLPDWAGTPEISVPSDPKAKYSYEEFPSCLSDRRLSKDAFFNIDFHPGRMLLTPAIHQLLKEFGPAGLHIISHYAISFKKGRVSSANSITFAEDSAKNCNTEPKLEYAIPGESDSIFSGYNAADICFHIGDPFGWLVGVLRGEAPMLYDHVARHCFRARSYFYTAINPIYSGVRRSDNDIARFNTLCKDTAATEEILHFLL